MSPRHLTEAPEVSHPTWRRDALPAEPGGPWVNQPSGGQDVGEALQVLQAIRILQRWVTARPLGADTVCLTSTSLTLADGESVVATISIPVT